MKNNTAIFLTLLLTTVLSACGVNGKQIHRIDFNEWKMQSVMSNNAETTDSEEALVIAVGSPDEFYPNAKVVDLILTANTEEVTLIDSTNNLTYSGTYIIAEESSKQFVYEITIDDVTAHATLSYNRTQIPTLAINFGEYTVYFLPSETDTK